MEENRESCSIHGSDHQSDEEEEEYAIFNLPAKTVYSAPQTPSSSSAMSKIGSSSEASLYVGDLDPAVTEAMLHEHFRRCGEIKSIRLCRDAATQKSLCYGYLNFHSEESRKLALEKYNFTRILGKPCRLMKIFKDLDEQKKTGGNIYVRNLAPTVDSKLLYDTFSMFGPIISCKVSLNDSGQSLGRGYVQYSTKESANEAVVQINGKIINGRPLQVDHYLTREERKKYFNGTNSSLFIRGTPRDCSEHELELLFACYGPVKSVYLPCIGTTTDKRGWGYVNFHREHDADVAMRFLNGFDLRGQILSVTKSRPKQTDGQKQEQTNLSKEIHACIGNLPTSVTEQTLIRDLSCLRNIIGPLNSVHIYRDHEGRSLGQAVITLKSPHQAFQLVYYLNGRRIQNQRITVALLEPTQARPKQDENSSPLRHPRQLHPVNSAPQPAISYMPQMSYFPPHSTHHTPLFHPPPNPPQNHIPMLFPVRNMNIYARSPLVRKKK
ncbi:hypothetical protein TRICI_005314 [Trichomonascus ciferrii]|uniref:RRM domain-containing protein n=1 Tax=Trichomonascus ciferrii TaxID=44093 RepID=A0A642V0J2_9ASCO|nr:hypothetical protein TRICI_005314 [Trichomonascus ciferrii]